MGTNFFKAARIYCGMEIFVLVLLYYFSQNPAFAESVKPLMGKIKNSEQMLNFLNDLSKFSSALGMANMEQAADNSAQKPQKDGGRYATNAKTATKTDGATADSVSDSAPQHGRNEEQKNPQSPTSGIADEFIQNILESYLAKNR